MRFFSSKSLSVLQFKLGETVLRLPEARGLLLLLLLLVGGETLQLLPLEVVVAAVVQLFRFSTFTRAFFAAE